MHNRQTQHDKFSCRGSYGAQVMWDNYHANLPPVEYPPDLPSDCFRITVDNLISGKSHIMLFHPGSRRGRYKIDVDGEFWRECGWSEAMVRIRKSCKRTPLYIYD